jgi:hypothetical protein
MKQLETTHFKCRKTNKYISQTLVNNSFCDCNDAALIKFQWCDDEENKISFDITVHISFQKICNGFTELLPDEQNETDETECQQWPCDNIYMVRSKSSRIGFTTKQ